MKRLADIKRSDHVKSSHDFKILYEVMVLDDIKVPGVNRLDFDRSDYVNSSRQQQA